MEKDVLAAGRTFEAIRTDFADIDAVRALGADLAARARPVDILVNNAGTIRRAPAAEHTDTDWDRAASPSPATRSPSTASPA